MVGLFALALDRSFGRVLSQAANRGVTPSTTGGMPFGFGPLPIVVFDAGGGRLPLAATVTDP